MRKKSSYSINKETMNYHNHHPFSLLYFVFIGILHLTLLSFAGQAPQPKAAPPAAQLPELSEEELGQIEQQMETEINSFVQDLPPEQQEQFYKDVDALTEAMSKMSEEELTQFIEGVFAEAPAPVQPEKPVIPPKPEEKEGKPKEKEEKKKPKLPKKQMEAAVKMLDTIFDHIDSFLHKAEIILEFPRKVEKWGKAGFIPNWDATLSWLKIQEDSIRLAQKMRSLMSRNPKTKEYYFIENLIQDKALYNNLEHLEKQLSTYEPKIDLAEFNFRKLDLSSKTAARTTIGYLLEAFKLKKIPTAIDTIIAKYAQIAEKIKKEEDEAVKQALEELKKPRVPATVKVIGVPEEPEYAVPTYPTADYGYGVPGYYAPYAPAKPGEPRVAKPAERKPKDKKEEEAKPTAAAIPTPPAEEKTVKHLEDLEAVLEEATEAIDDILVKPNLAQALTTTPLDTTLEESLKTVRKAIQGTTQSIGRFNVRYKELSDKAKEKYESRIRSILKEPKEKIDQLKNKLGTITTPHALTIQQRIKKLEEAIAKIGKK